MKYSAYLFLFMIFIRPAPALSTVTFYWGIDETLDYQIKIARQFSKIIKKRTNSKVKILVKTYPSPYGLDSKIGKERSNFDIHQKPVGALYSKFPVLKFWELPYLFTSQKHVEKYIESKRSSRLLRSLENSKWKNIGYSYAGGFLFFITKSKIKSLYDLKGMSCELETSFGFFAHFLKPIGVKSVSRGAQCLEALSSSVDFLTSNVNLTNKLSLSRHRVFARLVTVSKKRLSSLKKQDRAIFLEELKKSLKKERELVYKGVDTVVSFLENKGLEVYKFSKKNIKTDQKRMKPLINKYLKGVSARALQEIKYIKTLENSKF